MLSQQQNPQEMDPINSDNNQNIKPFSIREYVLGVRQKDISHSWPFPKKYLQVCHKHGISNVLPPLEPHDSARDQLLEEGVSLNQSQEKKANAVFIEDNFTSTDGQDIKMEVGCDLYSDDMISEVSRHFCHLSLLNDSCKHEEKIHFSSDIFLDPMLSRIQTSTTMRSLHHQVVQSTEALATHKKLRHKRRKRKMRKPKIRLMVDIYAVARHCALEDDVNCINGLRCDSMTPEVVGEGCGQMACIYSV